MSESTNSEKPEETDSQAVFHPIDLNNNVEDDSNDEQDFLVSSGTKPIAPTSTVPTIEDAIEQCFLMAVNTHDAPLEEISRSIWDWQVQSGSDHSIPEIDATVEEEARKNWIPRPLFLPTWAVKEE